MLTKRVIPCLDVRNGRVTKGVKFQNNVDMGDPVEMALAYSEGGADELVFYDITASAERRPIDIGMVEAVARAIRIPFAVGGGISCVADMERVILAGAEKVSVNSLAVRNPQIIAEGARAFGRQCIVLGMDPVKSGNPACPSGYEVTTRGFREFTGMDAVAWAKRAAELGAGEIVVNSVDADGTRAGFELTITRLIAGRRLGRRGSARAFQRGLPRDGVRRGDRRRHDPFRRVHDRRHQIGHGRRARPDTAVTEHEVFPTQT